MWQHIYYTSSNIFTTRPFESNIFASPALNVYPFLSLMYIPIYNYITSIQFYLATRTSTACTRATTRCSPAASPSTSSELPTTQQPRWQSKHVYCLSIDYAGKKLFLMFHVSVWMRKHQLSFLQLGHKHQK